MVGAKKTTKKKRPNKKLFIAIGLAAFLGILLLMLMQGQGSQVSKINEQLQSKDTQITELTKKLEEIEQQRKLDAMKAKFNQGSQAPEVEKKKNYMSVVVAKRPLSSGTRLSSADLAVEEWPQEAVPLNAATFEQSLIGRITSADLASGEPILPGSLIDKDTKTLNIPDGFRAMTIPITNITGVGGFITPGARVDLLTVVPKSIDKDNKTDEKVSKILMQNVKVLAVSGKSDEVAGRGSGSKDTSSSTVTVAVPAEQAVKLALAFNNGEGNIQVVLRGFQDGSNIDKIAIDTGELITGQIQVEAQEVMIPEIDLPPPPSEATYNSGSSTDLNSILSDVDGLPPPAPPTAQTRTHSIEIIQANSRQEVSFETEM